MIARLLRLVAAAAGVAAGEPARCGYPGCGHHALYADPDGCGGGLCGTHRGTAP